ncbi:hypothetical protein ACWCY1_35175 [Streptomyces goshikiensis]
MKRTTLRAAGVSALAAVAFGIAVPAASAATSAPVRTVAVVQTADVQGSVSSSAANVTAAPGVGGPSNGEAGASVSLKPVWEAIKKSGLAKKAWEAAKKGQTGFVAWVNSLSDFNPAKWAIKALPGYMTQELITYILNNYAG